MTHLGKDTLNVLYALIKCVNSGVDYHLQLYVWANFLEVGTINSAKHITK